MRDGHRPNGLSLRLAVLRFLLGGCGLFFAGAWPLAHAEPADELHDGVRSYLDALRDSDRWRDRMEAAVRLARSEDIRARRALVRALDDPHYAVRAAAVRGLAHIGDARDCESIVDLLADDDPYVRAEARHAIERFSPESIEPIMIRALARHPDGRVRLAVAERLAANMTPLARRALLDSTGDEREVGRFAASALRALPKDESLAVFLDGLDRPDDRVQIASIEALADMNAREAVDPIMALLDARMPSIVRAASNALRQLKGHIASQPYFVAARRSRDRPMRAQALRVVGIVGGDEALPVLLNAVDDRDVIIRGAAVSALAELQEIRAIPRLTEAAIRPENVRILSLIRNTLATLERIRDLPDRGEGLGSNVEDDASGSDRDTAPRRSSTPRSADGSRAEPESN